MRTLSAVLVALVVLFGWGWLHALGNTAEAVRDAGLAHENLVASQAELERIDGVWRQRVAQAKLDDEGDETPVVTVEVVVDPEPVIMDPVVPLIVGDTVKAHFEDAFLAIDVVVVDVLATITYDVKPQVVPLGVRCGAPNEETGIRPVIITAETELPLTLNHGRVDPDVCNAAQQSSGFWKGALAGAGTIATILILGG